MATCPHVMVVTNRDAKHHGHQAHRKLRLVPELAARSSAPWYSNFGASGFENERERMKNKIAAMLAALVMALGFTVAVNPAPANAGWPGGSVDYWRYYGGTVSYIILDCEGRYLSLHPGEWSKSIGGCSDVDGFFIHVGSKLFCGERYGVTDYVYYPGWHSIGNFAYRACEMRKHGG